VDINEIETDTIEKIKRAKSWLFEKINNKVEKIFS
jgi:hypothetical protein